MTDKQNESNDMTDDDVLADLRRELRAVSPSPAFAARVRERIETEEAKANARATRWFDWPRLVAVGAAVIIVAGVGLWQLRSDGQKTDGAPGVKIDGAPGMKIDGAPGLQTRGTPGPKTGGSIERTRPSAEPIRSTADPALEVITTQPAILRAAWDRFNAAERAIAADVSLPSEVRDVVVAPVEIDPVVVKWLVEPPASPGVFPIIRRVSADMAERSTK